MVLRTRQCQRGRTCSSTTAAMVSNLLHQRLAAWRQRRHDRRQLFGNDGQRGFGVAREIMGALGALSRIAAARQCHWRRGCQFVSPTEWVRPSLAWRCELLRSAAYSNSVTGNLWGRRCRRPQYSDLAVVSGRGSLHVVALAMGKFARRGDSLLRLRRGDDFV